MSIAAIREQIKVILSGVEGIGVVHDYERLAVDWNKVLDLLKDSNGRINAWMFFLERSQKRQVSHGEQEKARIFKFRGIMGLKDAEATGLIFEDLVDRVQQKFDGFETLNQTCLTINPDWGELSESLGYQIDLIEPRMFGGVLCHYQEGRLCAIETIEI
jgi:hypothetical protein